MSNDGKNRVLIESFPNRELVEFALNLFPRRDSLPNVLARRIASLVDLLARESGYNDDLATHLDSAQDAIAEIVRMSADGESDYQMIHEFSADFLAHAEQSSAPDPSNSDPFASENEAHRYGY